MFEFLKKPKENRDLEALMERIDSNMANNYKDAAQEYLKEFEVKLSQLVEAGQLKEDQKKHYEDLLDTYRIRMKGFTHKDQKPYWT